MNLCWMSCLPALGVVSSLAKLSVVVFLRRRWFALLRAALALWTTTLLSLISPTVLCLSLLLSLDYLAACPSLQFCAQRHGL